jgi:hypothetical protein
MGPDPMTPAERLRAAADTIEERANTATAAMGDGSWRVELTGDGYGTQNAEGYLTASGMAEEVAEHVALWDPPTALLLVPLLRKTAHNLDNTPGYHLAEEVDAFVDAILTGGAK